MTAITKGKYYFAFNGDSISQSKATLFPNPETFLCFNPEEGVIKLRHDDVGVPLSPFIIEVISQIDGGEDLLQYIKDLLKKKSLTGKLAILKQVLRDHHKLNSQIVIGNGAVAKMTVNLVEEQLKTNLVLDAAAMVKTLRNHNSGKSVPLEMLAIVTGNRPLGLERALNSYSTNLKKFGREMEIFVADDSRDDSVISNNRLVVEKIRAEGVPVRHFTKTDRIELINFSASQTTQKYFQFLIEGVGLGQTYGANRNAVHLCSLGKRVFSADDDTIAKTTTTKQHSKSVKLTSKDFQEVKTFSERSQALQSAVEQEVDIIGWHDDSTGQIIGDVLANTIEHGGQVSGLSLPEAKGWIARQSQIIISMNGLISDSGSGASLGFLHMQGAELSKLLSNFGEVSLSREITKCADQIKIASSGPCMTTFYSYDNREGMIPFFPNFRMEDEGFKDINLAAHGNALLSYLPFMLEHSPLENRKPSQIMMPNEARIECYHILSLVVAICSVSKPPLAGQKYAIRKKYFLDSCLRFLQKDFSLYKRDMLDILVSKKFVAITQKKELLKKIKGSLPRATVIEIESALSKDLKLLGQPMYLCNQEILKAEPELLKAEMIQHHHLKTYFEACLEFEMTRDQLRYS